MTLVDFLSPHPNAMWRLARQIGVRHAIVRCHPKDSGLNPPWDIEALRTIRDRLAGAGFTFAGLEGDQFDMTRIKLGLPGRDEDIECYRRMLHNMGELGIPLLCYNFFLRVDWHRTDNYHPARGGARVTRFRLSDLPATLTAYGEVSAEHMWENYRYFIQAVMPAAEAAGVRMGLHPDDPPIPRWRGLARIFSTPEAFLRAQELAPSPNNGVTFCQANFRLMTPAWQDWAARFAREKRIVFIHFRDVVGQAEDFAETFHDNGPTDPVVALRCYRDLGVDVPLRCDHVPTLDGEEPEHTGYGAYGRLFANGYVLGIMHTLGMAPREVVTAP